MQKVQFASDYILMFNLWDNCCGSTMDATKLLEIRNNRGDIDQGFWMSFTILFCQQTWQK